MRVGGSRERLPRTASSRFGRSLAEPRVVQPRGRAHRAYRPSPPCISHGRRAATRNNPAGEPVRSRCYRHPQGCPRGIDPPKVSAFEVTPGNPDTFNQSTLEALFQRYRGIACRVGGRHVPWVVEQYDRHLASATPCLTRMTACQSTIAERPRAPPNLRFLLRPSATRRRAHVDPHR